ncbi:hypothetical protein Q8F55_002424 [Vanrija albida]|uniref:Hexosyltransferase n=1 Tax=Vanrija albida TaxID=181172 RepID=A0ABR3QAS3_9TREE
MRASHHQRVLGHVSSAARSAGRRAARRPRTTALLVLLLACVTFYTAFYHTVWGKHGRWYWNYAVAVLPLPLARYAPQGDWGPIDYPPRFVPEIYAAPWMGDFALPDLTPPVYAPVADRATAPHVANASVALTSPALIKLTIFSTVKPAAAEKRALIRRLSPVFNVPERLRHLIEVKFALGHAYHVGVEGKENWAVDEETEAALKEEQRVHGDLLRLDLEYGENLREGKILEWIRAVGMGRDGGRPAWWLFKVDDDSVLNLPNFLDTLLAHDASKPIYAGTSLARWPAYHHHFTGLVTGFSWPLLRTLAEGIDKMTHAEIVRSFDDDVLTGELMYCDVRTPPENGWLWPLPRGEDRRTGLIRLDFLRRMGDPAVWLVKGDLAWHGWWLKPHDGYTYYWRKTVQGVVWRPPQWLEKYADPAVVAREARDEAA